MIKQIAMAAALAACGLGLAGCEKPKPVVAAKKPPAPDYQMAETVAPPPAGQIRAICFNDADLSVFSSASCNARAPAAYACWSGNTPTS